MRVEVSRYFREGNRENEDLGTYENVRCIMPIGTERSEGIAWVSFDVPGGMAVAIEEGFHIEQSGGGYLDVVPDEEEEPE